MKTEIREIPKEQIYYDPENPRSNFKDDDVDSLLNSIEKDGQLIPTNLEKLGDKKYMVIEGHRRTAAIKKSKKIKTVKSIIEEKLSPKDRLLKQILIESHNNSFSPIDRDKSWKRLWDMDKYDAKSFAKKLSVSKGKVDAFLDRMDLGVDFIKSVENVTAYNIAETKRIKDEKLRKKVLKYCHKNELTRDDIRKLSGVVTKVEKDVVEDVFKNKISIDDAKNMVGLDEEKQKMALETTKSMNKHKKNLKRMIGDGSITTEKIPYVEDMSNKINDFQMMFFKLSSDLRVMSDGLNNLAELDTKKYINTQMEGIIKSCIMELKKEVLPAIKSMEKKLEKI